MSGKSSFQHAKRLEGAGLGHEQAATLVEVMEDILGSPLTVEVFKADMASFKEVVEKSIASMKTEAELRQQAFEKSIEASIVKGRLATLMGIWVVALGVAALLARTFLGIGVMP